MRTDIDRGCTPSPAWENRGASQVGAAGLALSGSPDAVGSSGPGGARLMSVKGLSL